MVGLVLLALICGAGGGTWWYTHRDPLPKGPVSIEAWANAYCDAAEPYEEESKKLFNSLSSGLAPTSMTSPGGASRLHDALGDFDELATTFLDDVKALGKKHPVSGITGAALTKSLLDGIDATKTKLAAAMQLVSAIDVGQADYVALVLTAMATSGLDLKTRVDVSASPALDQLNESISARCTSVFTPKTA